MTEIEVLSYGAGRSREGLCLQLRLGPHEILLDCGLRDMVPILGDRPPADWVFCSHAHRDHARGLLALHEAYPSLPMFASTVTAALLPINWPDRPAATIPAFCQGLAWRSPLALAPDLDLELFPAGHLPGAALCLLTYHDRRQGRDYRVVFTGDFFLSNGRLVEGLPLSDVRGLQPDVAIVEGSYGTVRHPRRRSQENHLADLVRQALDQGRSVLLPVPILGLGQELLMLLRSHHYFTGRDFTIWVDPTVAAGCDAYLNVVGSLPASVQNFARHQNLFWDDRVKPLVRRLPTEATDWHDPDSPCLVLVDDDPSLDRLCDRYCARGPWLILLAESGQASAQSKPESDSEPVASPSSSPGSRPGSQPNPEPDPAIDPQPEAAKPADRSVNPSDLAPPGSGQRWQIDHYLLSEHCDALGTLQLIHNLRPQHVVLVHGSPEYLSDLAGLGELSSRYQVHCPIPGLPLSLAVGASFVQPAAPAERYEGEISETGEGATIDLPAAIVHSPRWQTLADTGLIEARWQGNDLVLRCLSQRELLDRDEDWVAPEATCCQTCGFYHDRHCRNPESPLHDRKVAPDGCCPSFAAIEAHHG